MPLASGFGKALSAGHQSILQDTIVAELRLILVTPEKTLFDKPAASIRVPMFDGSAGVYPGRAPLVGRLGAGELKLEGTDGNGESFFIDGGFIQIKGSLVSVLTNSAMPVSEISRSSASESLEAAKSELPKTDEDATAKEHKIDVARKMLNLASVD